MARRTSWRGLRWVSMSAALLALSLACRLAPGGAAPTATAPLPASPIPFVTPAAEVETPTLLAPTASPGGEAAMPTAGAEATVPPAATLPPTPGVTAAPTQAPTADPGAAEAIQIFEPGPGSRLVSPMRVQGTADSTFEQSLVAVLVLADGTEVAQVPLQIQAEMGQRGPFEGEIVFNVTGEQQAFLQVFATSARDGGVTHLSAVGITLADSGAAEIRRAEPQNERITILRPALGERLPGGVVRVEGYGWAAFEQTLIVEVLDENGQVIGRQPVMVQSLELGQPGFFWVDVAYTRPAAGPGRVVVRDESPAFGGNVHLSSVEVWLE